MARARQLFLTLASSSALYSGLVPALGLGEITLHSALNQPLNAEIVLLDAGDLSPAEVNIGLATVAAFKRAGVDRVQFLDDLRFTPLLQGNHSLIRVTTNRPVREPYLNFIVEVERANGRLLREYTILIDPPGLLAERPLAAVLPARALPVERESMALPVRQALPAASHGQLYTVRGGDSLWKIAQGLRQENTAISQLQLMADIYALNPQAFAGGDINRLKAGASLLLPDALTPAPLSSTVSSSVEGAEIPTNITEPAPAVSSAEIAGLIAAQQRLDQSLAASELERLQLQQQMSDLQVQLTQLQLQVEEKDQQMAVLQGQVVDASATPVSPAATLREVVEPIQLPALNESSSAGRSGDVQAQEDALGFLPWLTGAVLALFAGGLLWRRQRSVTRQAADFAAEPTQEESSLTPVRLAPVTELKPSLGKVVESSTQVASDPLEEANIYIAYGSFHEARDALVRILENEPQRADVRLRLLEVLAQLGDRQRFAAHEQWLLRSGEYANEVERIKQASPKLAVQAQEEVLADVVLDLPDAEIVQALEEDLTGEHLNLDELSLDADWSLISPFDQPARAKSASTKVSDAQFGSDLRSLPEVFELPTSADGFNPFPAKTKANAVDEDIFDDVFAEPPALASSGLDDLAGSPENMTRLNMALAYIEQGSLESACNILNQVLNDGDDLQKQQARELLERIA